MTNHNNNNNNKSKNSNDVHSRSFKMSAPRTDVIMGAMKERLHPAHSPDSGTGSSISSSMVTAVVVVAVAVVC